ncbi:MAG: beta-glucosidase [Clostridia bacterium]|nr:beta-glucosidase [Clostridia bacterium]
MGFKKGFIWGAATAAFQIEGAALEDGKGPSVWDVFSHEPGKVLEGHNGDVACDHYHRFREDVALMAQMGIRSYRFSLSWPRIMPEGTGRVNEKGVAFYNALIDELLAHGIRPFVTLFHWDYPEALHLRGGWMNPDSAEWFRAYTEVCAGAFGDRVKDWITLNEPQCFIGLGYQMGLHAPGLKMVVPDIVKAVHHTLKAHGLAVKTLRELVPGCKVGYAPCGGPFVPQTNSPEDIEAARRVYFATTKENLAFSVALWSDPALLGSYPEDFLRLFGKHLPSGWQEDLSTIHQPLDYYCQNIYYGAVVRAADNAQGFELIAPEVGHPKTALNWGILPDVLYWGPRYLYERYRTPFVISENGLSCHDVISLDGKVHDPNRQDYTHRYLLALRRAAEDGIDVAGYFHWSLMDNFEWAHGYNERFGLIYVDYATQQRIIKDSAWWYKTVMESNGENL